MGKFHSVFCILINNHLVCVLLNNAKEFHTVFFFPVAESQVCFYENEVTKTVNHIPVLCMMGSVVQPSLPPSPWNQVLYSGFTWLPQHFWGWCPTPCLPSPAVGLVHRRNGGLVHLPCSSLNCWQSTKWFVLILICCISRWCLETWCCRRILENEADLRDYSLILFANASYSL